MNDWLLGDLWWLLDLESEWASCARVAEARDKMSRELMVVVFMIGNCWK